MVSLLSWFDLRCGGPCGTLARLSNVWTPAISGRSARTRTLALLVVVAVLCVVSGACGGDSDAAAPVGSSSRKVTVAGDSISVGLGSHLRTVLQDGDEGDDDEGDGDEGDGDDTVVKVIGEGGTGLARPDNFDWPSRIRALAAEFPPDVLVFSVGSNDAQDLTDADGRVVVTMSDEEAWDAEYSRRLAEVFDAFAPADGASARTEVIWVGHVHAKKQVVGDTNRRVHELAASVAADRPWVDVEDLGELLGTGDGDASRCLLPDGLHLTADCLDEAARALVPAVDVGR